MTSDGQESVYAHLTRLDALDLLGQVKNAGESGLIGTMVRLLGVTEDLAEEMTLDDLQNAVNVRIADLARRAGISPGP